MPPKPKNAKASGSATKALSQMGPPPAKKARTKPPVWDFTGSQSPSAPEKPSQKSTKVDTKGKGKATPQAEDNRLWADRYEPTIEAELAVHVRKVQNVRDWLVEALEGGLNGKLRKYRRILVLTGPAGTGKSATVRVLAREMGFDIMEWRSTMDENFARDDTYDSDFRPMDQEALFDKFEAFVGRASACENIFALSEGASDSTRHSPKQVILLEDLPNILHPRTQDSFHAVLRSFVHLGSQDVPGAPMIIVISDAGTRGEASDERISQGGSWGKDVVDVRSVIPKDILDGPYVRQIPFRPIAPTLLKKALQALTDKHFASSTSILPKDMLDIIVNSANGDIRSAIMALEFACSKGFPKAIKGKGKAKATDTQTLMESITRREQSLALFHMIGRVLYNKRRGQPAPASALKRDIAQLKIIDAGIKDQDSLPTHLREHERIPSRVNIDLLYSDSPIDSSLFSLYLHQNYTQFCNTVEEVDGVAETLSYVDASGGEAWHQANPHQFHLTTMGTLHALPSPASSTKKTMCKPEFFEALKKEREGMDGVADVRGWLRDGAIGIDGSSWSAGGWSDREVATELGGVLKALSLTTSRPSQSQSRSAARPPPTSHRLFSSLVFVKGSGGTGTLLDEEDDGVGMDVVDEGELERLEMRERLREEELKKDTLGGWLESDDIEEW